MKKTLKMYDVRFHGSELTNLGWKGGILVGHETFEEYSKRDAKRTAHVWIENKNKQRNIAVHGFSIEKV